jgi:hypothetical protein
MQFTFELTVLMKFLRTQLGTDFREPSSWWGRFTSFESANPTYRGKYQRVRSWLIEFDEVEKPAREIGLDEAGSVVMAGPSKVDYGFWLDIGMRFADFNGEQLAPEYFEEMWAASGIVV